MSAGHSDHQLPRVGWRHGEMKVVPGKTYALRVSGYRSHGNEHFKLDAFVRPDKGDGYDRGEAFGDGQPTGGDLCCLIFGNNAGQIVETAEVRDLFDRPAHPYTRGLLDSLPTTGGRAERLRAIPGTVPSPSDWPSGCRFRPRCSLAEDECGSDQIDCDLPGMGRSVRCWKGSA